MICLDEDVPRARGRCLLSRGMCAKAGVCAWVCVCVCSSEYELTLTHSQVEPLIFAFDLQFYDSELHLLLSLLSSCFYCPLSLTHSRT